MDKPKTFEETLKHPIFSKELFLALDGLTYAAKVLNNNGADRDAVSLIIEAIGLLVIQTRATNKKIENQRIVEATLKDLSHKRNNEASQ